MMKKPLASLVLSLIGGMIVLLVGVLISMATALFTVIIGLGGTGGILGLPGVAYGALMILGAVMLYTKPKQHTIWGR